MGGLRLSLNDVAPTNAGAVASLWTPRVRTPVTVEYSELLDASAALRVRAAIREAFVGPHALGLLAVSGVPGVDESRAALLRLAEPLATLMDEDHGACESVVDRASNYCVGWSKGEERLLASGRPDVFKASFYANPEVDRPTEDSEAMEHYPTLNRPNLWPTAHLPELETAFKALGSLLVHVCLLLARHIDSYLASVAAPAAVAAALAASRNPKGRFLYYSPQGDEPQGGDWCAWHRDLGSLTAMVEPQFLKGGRAVPCPDPRAGLVVKTPAGEEVRVDCPPGHIIIQAGLALEEQTGGLLKATEHCVPAPQGPAAAGVARATFAVFTQPNWDFRLPDGRLFGDMCNSTLNSRHHHQQNQEQQQQQQQWMESEWQVNAADKSAM